MLKNALIICFSFALTAGCIGSRPIQKDTVSAKIWPIPEKPIIVQINEFKKVENGFFINEEDAVNLVNNVDELKAYILKLEETISKMREYYK